jgi:hypothetical protein
MRRMNIKTSLDAVAINEIPKEKEEEQGTGR